MHDERLRFGALPQARAGTAFHFRHASADRVWLETEGGARFPLKATADHRFEALLPLPPGSAYRYVIAAADSPEQWLADPAARERRSGPEGFSLVVDTASAAWKDDDWRGRPWHEVVLCELDPTDGFDAAATRLEALAATGFTAVCLMPVALPAIDGAAGSNAAVPARVDVATARASGAAGATADVAAACRSAGPVFPFAPAAMCGSPDELRALVDKAHGLGLAVVFGTVAAPFGCDLAPSDLDPVDAADFLTACAVHWVRDGHFDALWLAPGDWPVDFAAVVREAAGPQRRVHLLWADRAGGGSMPEGFDARWDTAASDALDDLSSDPPAADGSPARRGSDPGRSEGANGPSVPSPAVRLAEALAGSGAAETAPTPVNTPATSVIAARRPSPAVLACLLTSPHTPLLHEAASTPSGPLGALLRLRAERLVGRLTGSTCTGARALGDAGWVASWKLGDGSLLVVGANAGATPLAWPDAPAATHRIHSSDADAGDLAPGAARVYLVPGLSPELAELARHAGVALEWSDQAGRPQTVSRDTVLRVLDALGHPCDTPQAISASRAAIRSAESAPGMLTVRVGESLVVPLPPDLSATGLRARLALESGETRPLLPALREAESPGEPATVVFDGFDVAGYHRLSLESGGRTHALDVAVAPRRAYDAGLQRAWGTSVQLHALRPESSREGADPGVGDFSALAAFARSAGLAGAQVLAISPTHAGFAADAANFSPYSPSSRLFHNVLFIDPLAVCGAQAAHAAAAAAGIEPGASAPPAADELIDWPSASTRKLRWLRAIFDQQRPPLPSPMPVALRLHATFEALHAHFHAEQRFDWRQWPEPFQDPEGAAVADFAAAHADDVGFHAWLQLQAEAGLETAQQAAVAAGMRVGLVSDLAIGMSGAGSHGWASRQDLLVGLEIGAPPDSMNPRGQSWGLTAFSPAALVERSFEPFLQTLRAAMRQTGGVRIDHVLGLNRLWLVPTGLPATEGAYVRYPLRDFLNLLILESHRQKAIVIGEDLGTVPDGFREVLADAGVRGMAVLWLERTEDGVGFKPPATWSAEAVAMTTTHDLPTAAGWWQARDVDWRERIGIEPDAAAARRRREAERLALAALVPGADADADTTGVDLAIAAVSQAPSALVLVPVEDLLGLVEQPNLPGTVDEHPNWRRRLPTPADRLLDAAAVRARIDALKHLRGG